MDFNGLSIDQAPPISAPLRFFLSAPLFGVIAGFLILLSDPSLLMNRYSMESIAVTHALTIGFMGFVILGALTQMLPVLAGVKMPKVVLITAVAHAFLVVGLLFMLTGLLNSSQSFNTLALIGLGVGFLMMISVISMAIIKVKNFTATVIGMATSLVFLLFIVLMGILLLYSYISSESIELHSLLANIHSVWGVFGFAGILIIGVSFQVLPMFYVAPRFKKFCKKRVVALIVAGLILWLLLNIFFESYSFIAKIWIATFFFAFSATVWKKLNERRRPISDVTVWYWRSASIFLTLGSFTWVLDELFASQYIVLAAILLGGGFILSIMIGMLYKIVPFLVWFHLNASGYMSIPTMNEMIDKKLAKAQFYLFIVSVAGFAVSFIFTSLLQFFAITFIASMFILQWNIIVPVLTFIKTKKTKPDFDMSAFATN